MWADLRGAFSFLTIIPLGYAVDRKPGWSFTWYPLVGAFIGMSLVATALLIPFDDDMRALAVLLTWVLITGGLHLDGFGDSCDGLLATTTPERRLEIMKDPRAGTWAVVGLILLLLGKWVALRDFPIEWLLIPPIMGRWSMVMAAGMFPYGREAGLGGYFREGLTIQQVSLATIFMLGLLVLITQQIFPSLLSIGIGVVVILVLGRWAVGRLGGGLTGDVYGAMCELTELCCLWGLNLWVNA